MPLLSRCGLVVLFAVLWWPCTALAQFTEPTPQELQMKADPKAPDENAVYLYCEDVTDQPKGTRTFYERIKVLTEKGKGMATLRYSYVPGWYKVDVEGRTIHPDGTIVPLTEKPADLVDVKTKYFQVNTLTSTLPSVEVGSILEYRVTERHSSTIGDPTWMVQQDHFVRKAHYVFRRNLYFMGPSYVARLAPNAKIVDDKKGTYTLDLEDIPPLPKEDWMPPLNTLKWRVSFFFTEFKTSQAYWDQAGQDWAKFVRDFTKPTGTLKKAVEQIVAPGDNESQKAEKIYAAVMKLENTDFTRRKSHAERKKEKIKDIHNAQDVWKDQQGTGDEIALLFVALCRAADLNVEPMKVVDRTQAIFDESLLNDEQMDDYIAVGHLDGKEFYFDPGERMCPFGMLHWKHSLASGFRLSEKAAVIAHTPSVNYKMSAVHRIADLTVDESGAVTGNIRVLLSGQDALNWRQIALENDADEVKKQFNEWLQGNLPEGVQGEFDHFLALDQYDVNLLALVKVSGNLGTTTGKRFFLPGQFFESKAKHPFVAEEKRAIPVDVHYAHSELDDVTYRLPAGYQVESGPKTDKISWPDHAIFANSTGGQTGQVNVVRNLLYNYTIVGPQDYGSLRDFYVKVAEADQQPLVLTRATAAAAKASSDAAPGKSP